MHAPAVSVQSDIGRVPDKTVDVFGSGTDQESIPHPPDGHVGSFTIGLVGAHDSGGGGVGLQEVRHPLQRFTK